MIGRKEDEEGVQEEARLFLSPKTVDVFSEQFRVGTPDGELLFLADANRVVVSSDKLWIKSEFHARKLVITSVNQMNMVTTLMDPSRRQLSARLPLSH